MLWKLPSVCLLALLALAWAEESTDVLDFVETIQPDGTAVLQSNDGFFDKMKVTVSYVGANTLDFTTPNIISVKYSRLFCPLGPVYLLKLTPPAGMLPYASTVFSLLLSASLCSANVAPTSTPDVNLAQGSHEPIETRTPAASNSDEDFRGMKVNLDYLGNHKINFTCNKWNSNVKYIIYHISVNRAISAPEPGDLSLKIYFYPYAFLFENNAAVRGSEIYYWVEMHAVNNPQHKLFHSKTIVNTITIGK